MEVRETAAISERAANHAKSTGKMRVQFISPGWGTSGYYSPEVLQEAASERIIPAGTHMYADHPDKASRENRPERSIRDLMAVTTSDAQVASNGALVGEVRVMAPYQELITDLKDHIGVSVLGDATDVYEGEAEGRTGRIIAGLAKINSVDFVTRAGRGGQVLELLESAAAQALGDAPYGDPVEVLPDAWLTDGIHVELAEALEEIATSAAGVAGTEKLHAYWRHGEGAAKIRWGVAGDFQRCVDHLGKYVADPKGYCAKMHKDVTGARPGQAAGESAEPTEHDLEEAGRVYHYKHGWIPLDHSAANDRGTAKVSRVKSNDIAYTVQDEHGKTIPGSRTTDIEKAKATAKGAAKAPSARSNYAHQTSTVNGHYAYRASDGDWYVIDKKTGKPTGKSFSDRKEAVAHLSSLKSKESDVPATRSDSTKTIEETTEVTMGKIQIEESEHTRLLEEAGRVDELTTELETTKARADKAEADLAEATKPPEGDDKGKPTAKGPRALVEAQVTEQKHEIAVLKAKDRARDIVKEELAEAWVAPATIARLTSGLLADLPLVEEKLDENALRARCVEARDSAELEAGETLEAAGFGKPRGLGASTPPAGGDTTRYTDQIAEGLSSAFDLTEAAAKTAVKGR